MADNSFIIGIDHVGYAVEDIDSASRFFSVLGFSFSEKRIDNLRRVMVSVGKMNSDSYSLDGGIEDGFKESVIHEELSFSNTMGGWKVELLSPVSGEKSPIDGILSKIGSAPYHICYKVSDIKGAVSYLQGEGFTLLSDPAPSEPLNGMVCFLYSGEIGIIELIER